MKILALTTEFLPFKGGVGTYAKSIVSAAAALGHEVTLTAPSYGVAESVHIPGVRISRYPSSPGAFKWSELLKLRSIFATSMNSSFDAIHLVDWPFWLASSLCQSPSQPLPSNVILTVCGSELLYFSKGRGRAVRILTDMSRHITRVCAISGYTKQLFSTEFSPNGALDIRVTHLAADPYWYQPIDFEPALSRLVQEYPIRPTAKRLLTVGRLDIRKGHKLAIRALGLFGATRRAQVQYLVVGTGDSRYLAELKALAISEGVETIFLGSVNQATLRDLYATSDLFCLPGSPHPTRVEGFGLVFLEAAAQGLRSVASAIGAVPEVVQPPIGTLVQVNDIAALSGELQKGLFGEPRQDSKAVKNYARSFSWERCASQTYGR